MLEERYLYPLVFEPGQAWKYGCFMDWAGRMVERVNDMSLQAYMEKNLWRPLGIKGMTFYLQQRPDLAARRPEMSMRDPGGNGKAVHTTMPAWVEDVHDALGDLGVYSSAEGYLKVLHSLLADDGKLFKAEAAELVFQRHMSEESHNLMMEMVSDSTMNNLLCGWFAARMQEDLGFSRNVVDGRCSGRWLEGGE